MPPQFQSNFIPTNPPVPENNPVPPKPPRKHTRLVLLVVLLAFVGVMAIAYLWLSLPPIGPGSVDMKTSQAITNEFADWKTYKNEEYGFEFKYPPKFTFDETGVQIGQINTFQDYPTNPEGGGFDIPFGCAIDFSIEANQKLLPLTSWIPKFTSIKGSDTEIMVDNQQGIRRDYTDNITQDIAVAIFIPKQDRVYFYSAQEASCISKLDQILSTFKFIK